MNNIHILEQVSLAAHTTMKVGGKARFFVQINTVEELAEAIGFAQKQGLPIFILGAGSNTIFSDFGFHGLVIKIGILGITYEGNRVTVGAGVFWDDFVRDVVAHNLWGVENLSLIPGSVGGSAVQNIGAYGVEAQETIFSVEAFDMEKMKLKSFFGEECGFGYRESIFKKSKNLIVTRVTFDLSPSGTPRTDYEDVKKYFENKGITAPALGEIREAIVAIRTAKMPAPPIGTAGSFFKNPIISVLQYEALKKQFPDIKAYPQASERNTNMKFAFPSERSGYCTQLYPQGGNGGGPVKLAAGWLLDHVGKWRGVRHGDAGVHEKQALILINYGKASASEILSLANEMKKDIAEKTGVTLEEEVVMM